MQGEIERRLEVGDQRCGGKFAEPFSKVGVYEDELLDNATFSTIETFVLSQILKVAASVAPCTPKTPAIMLIEDQRFLHEDLERLEQGISDRSAEDPRNVSCTAFVLTEDEC